MDFLKKLLFPSKSSNTLEIEADQLKETPVLDLSEDDIDNFLSGTSVEALVTSESLASISSLISHLDELNQIQREDLTMCSREKPEDLKDLVLYENSAKTVQVDLITDTNNSSEVVLTVTPKENNVSLYQSLSETGQIRTDEEPNTIVDESAINNAANVESRFKTGCTENKKAELPILTNEDLNSNVNFSTGAEIDKILTDLSQKLYSPQQSCHMLKFVNLGSEEINICPDMNKASCFCKLNDMGLEQMAKGRSTNEGIPKCDEDKDYKEELKKEVKLNKLGSACNNQIVIDLTQSEDEIEPDTENKIPKKDHPQNKLAAKHEAYNSKRDKPLLLLNLTPASGKLNVCEIYQTNSKTITQVLTNDADTQCRTIPAAKNTTADNPKDDANEIISISSTDDDSEPRSVDENIEPDTISCDNIQFYPDANSTEYKSVTDNPSKSKSNAQNTNCKKSHDKAYDSDYCSGYHSSDFEFISENEASMDGLIINYKSDKKQFKHNVEQASTTVRTIEIAKEPVRNRDIHENEPSNYVIPLGDEYLKLFEDVHNMNIVRYMENKSAFRSVNTTMLVEYDALGQNMRLMRKLDQNVDNEYKEEAEETAKKIREMYPGPNTKRQRRF